MTQKSVDAFRTIGEVSEDLSLPQHVLRFWETKFTQIKPMKRGGGRRYYKPDDVDLLRGIQYLLYVRGMTIKGVQRILKGQGPRFVVAVGKGDTTLLDELQADLSGPSRSNDDEAGDAPQGGEREAPKQPPPGRVRDEAAHTEHGGTQAEAVAGDRHPAAHGDEVSRPDLHRADHKAMSFPSFLKRGRDHEAVRSTSAGLSPAQTETLEAVVLELLECKRILDQVR